MIGLQNKLGFRFSLNKNLELLVFSKIMFLESYNSIFDNTYPFFTPFNTGISKNSLDSLD